MYLSKVLAALICLVYGYDKDNLSGAGVDFGEVDVDALVVAFALAGEVVACMLDRAVGRYGIVVEYEIFVSKYLAVLAEYEGRCIEIEIIARARAVGVPAESYGEFGKLNGNPLSFFEIDSHV